MSGLPLGPWGHIAWVTLVIVIVAQVAQRMLRPIVLRVAGFSPVLSGIVRRCDRPVQLLLPLAALQLALQGMPGDLEGLGTAQHLIGVLTIAAATWMAIAALRGVADGVIALHPANVADNLSARRVQTQTRVLARIGSGLVLLAGLSFILMTFPRARQLGASLLASAGVAGLIVGIAARSVFSNLLAGLQIALAQPIRIDDVLIVEGEWGRVEEIRATYVVLKIWDERRLIVPLGWFIEHPFQNWTRRSADILGTVFLWTDYTLPVEPIRREAKRLCEASPNWDGRVCVVQVTDASERAMQLRILVSSAASGPNFDLRCELREGLIDFVQREYPLALPALRARLDRQAPAAAESIAQ
ncbi:mechanosensitive ion channel domain-containing protein [Piscinibacter sp. XHJ-5]|uniref:mechanosensitive ion channel family protein n=1 Tax=Piscinibacter sp. XHJ-5 TaxID=3037797 RepID=UPI00245355CE|nr:mechanosensitive ion channel domain-containing protein [Piscinibacter sp. XHJ-5]